MINWQAFVIVVLASLVAASVLVTLFSVALRLGDGTAAWSKPASRALFVVCGLVVAFGIYVIVPALHSFG
ncbi:MAG: hypothetical protein ACOH10_09955 [Rhodoglobus sp.]